MSNFYPSSTCPPTVEHQYQAAKCAQTTAAERIIRAATPGLAKRFGQAVKLIDGWEHKKEDIMLGLVRMKFRDPELKMRLLETGNRYLVEGNNWHDNFWGNCSCHRCENEEGQNRLGKIIMQVREEIQNGALK